jgi:cell pole-organizing protein PopZ
MSKPEAAGAKSLEEILASIRKSLSGEGRAASKEVKPQPETAASPGKTGEDDGLLSARLAGALNGPANGAAHDDDFSDLLAPNAKETSPAARSAPRPADARDAMDALWFLRQPAGETENGDGAQPPSTLPQRREEAPPPTAPISPPRMEEVKLSRPEVLRASLPPLFGADGEHVPPARMPAPELREPQAAVGPATTSPAAKPPHAEPKPDLNSLLTARTQPVMLRTEDAAESAKAAPFVEPDPRLAPASEPVSNAKPTVETKPINGAAVVMPVAATATIEATASPETVTAKPATPASSTAAPVPPVVRTLEQVIGELLEPVIRQWLDANLPRMVEEVVRKEVARAIAAERNAPKV